MSKQKFHKGDHVQIAKNLGPSMSHFVADVEAVVIGSYKDQYGGSNTDLYTLHLKGHGKCAWYNERQLTLIEAARADLLKQWQDEEDAIHKQRSDHDWIFANGTEVLKKGYGSSVEALGRDVGIDDLWGPHGEGVVYYENTVRVLIAATPFLETGNKAGWLEFAKCFKENYQKLKKEREKT